MIKLFFLGLLAGIPLTFAFAPFHVYSLAFLSPALLLGIWLRQSAKQACWTGLSFGIGFFGTGASWVEICIQEFGGANVWLAVGVTALFIIALALYPATLGYVFRRFFQNYSPSKNALLIFPLLWVVWEYLRSTLFTGFPWLLLGYAQIDTPLRGFGPLIGVYGLSWLTAIVSGILVLIFVYKKFSPLFLFLIIFSTAFGFADHVWTTPYRNPITISLIQGNMPQYEKWDPVRAENNALIYKNLTAQHWSSQLIVWPEGALPWYSKDIESFLETLRKTAIAHHSAIMLGIPISSDKNTFFNGILLLGKNVGEYRKQHLVPFGEYTPLPAIFERAMGYFDIPMSHFTPGDAHQVFLQLDDIHIAPFLCYEIAFQNEVLADARNSNLLATLSDDSWYGKSIAAAQHLQITQMRSLETGRPQLVATNTGITAFVSPLGKITNAAPLRERTVLTATIQPMQGDTPLLFFYHIL